MRRLTGIALIVGLFLLFLPATQAFSFASAQETPVKLPEYEMDLPQQIPKINVIPNVERVQQLIENAIRGFDLSQLGALIDEIIVSGDISTFITALIAFVEDLCMSGGSISGYVNIVLNGLNALYTTLASAAVGILGVLPSGIVALLSGGVAILNTVGTLFVTALQAIGFTIEGIVGLTAIGGIISGLMSLVSLFLNVLNFAYTSGVAGIAVVALLLVVLSFVGLAVLGGAIVVLAAGEAILFVLVAVLFIIGFFAAIVTLGLACILFGIVITILTGMSAVGFTIISVIELIMKVMTTLMNTVSVPTSVFTFIPSWLGLLLCNLPASCLTVSSSWCGAANSCIYTIYPIISPILVIIAFPPLYLASIIIFIVLFAILGALVGGFFGLFFFIIGAIPGAIVGAILGGLFGLIVGLLTLVLYIIILPPLVLLAWIFSLPIYTLVYPILVLFISYICSGALSACNFLGIGADAITGFAGLIITGITLMLLRVGIDLMQTTLISEIVSVLVMFLERLQEISFLTKMAAYPIEVCVGITMLCAAIGMFLLNILLYPFNFVWQFVDMCLKGCYGVVCKPFIRPLGWS